MSTDKKIVTGLGKAELDRVLIRGHDLTKDLVGKITFADMTYLLLVGRFPSDGNPNRTRIGIARDRFFTEKDKGRPCEGPHY